MELKRALEELGSSPSDSPRAVSSGRDSLSPRPSLPCIDQQDDHSGRSGKSVSQSLTGSDFCTTTVNSSPLRSGAQLTDVNSECNMWLSTLPPSSSEMFCTESPTSPGTTGGCHLTSSAASSSSSSVPLLDSSNSAMVSQSKSMGASRDGASSNVVKPSLLGGSLSSFHRPAHSNQTAEPAQQSATTLANLVRLHRIDEVPVVGVLGYTAAKWSWSQGVGYQQKGARIDLQPQL